jgi:hypothetical protein
MLRRILGRKGYMVREKWRKLHKDVLNDLYTSPNIFLVIKSRRMRLARYVTHIWWRGEVHTAFGWGNLRERDHLEDSVVVGRIIIGWKCDVGAWTGLIWLRTRRGSDHL